MNHLTENFESPTPTPSDEEIVRRVCSGESALFEILMRRHNQRVYRAARSILGNQDAIEDVMQQAYLSAFSHLPQFTGAARFSTWMCRIAINEALAWARRQHRMVLVSEEDVVQPAESPQPGNPESDAASQEMVTILESAVDRLNPTYRSVFILRLVEGMNTDETAEALDVSADVVKTRLHRARLALQEDLVNRAGLAASGAFEFKAVRCDRVVAAVMSRLEQKR